MRQPVLKAALIDFDSRRGAVFIGESFQSVRLEHCCVRYATDKMQLQVPEIDKAIVAVAEHRGLLAEVDPEMRRLINAESDGGLLLGKDKKGKPFEARNTVQQANDQRHIDKLKNSEKLVHVVRTTADLSLPHSADMKNGI